MLVAANGSKRRMVQVYIVDPDEDVPLDKALLHASDPRLTDLTDDELFFDVGVKSLLEKHNELRDELGLGPTRIRDLKMLVVEIARFD
ncbi:MAG: hypothetical protein JW850_12885 [Thermoflexales bacterium]|nr:hypothetical protein [Thermoflexales bacterium]